MNNTPRKVFISFLGGSNYGECRYTSGDYISEPVRYIQEADLDILSRSGNWSKDDIAYILLTKGAEVANWLDNGHKTREGVTIMQPGLASRIAALGPTMTVETITGLPDGNNETEILEIFQRIYEHLRPGDTLYLDITHGFRYLPMLFSALGAYAKTLLGCTIAAISYGNFEGRDKETNIARIVDLLPLAALHDWALAADSFVRHGDASDLTDIANKSLKPILRQAKGSNLAASSLKNSIESLKQTVEDMRTCRGIDIVNATNISKLKKHLAQSDKDIIPLLKPVLEHISRVFDKYDSKPTYLNGLEAARWCLDHGLIQQSVTILFECINTYFCISYSLDYTKESKRDLVNKAFNFRIDSTPESKWHFKEGEDTPENREMIRNMMYDHRLVGLAKLYADLRDIRNDFNHSGMRENARKSQTIIKAFAEILPKVSTALVPSEVFINLSNHPSSCWSAEQIKAAERYGKIVDMPFPEVDPTASDLKIRALALSVLSGLPKDVPVTLHVMGEMTLTYAIVELCKTHGIQCVASTTERISYEDAEGNKVSTFRFVEFRRY